MRYSSYFIFSLIYLFFLFVYFFFLNDHMTHAHDAPDYFRRILSSPEYHGNHLIYEIVARVWYDITRPFTPESLSDFRLLSFFNSIFGALSIGIFYLLCKKAGYNKFNSIAACLAIGFSFYFLTYSTTIEIYIPALFFAFLAYYKSFAAKPNIKTAIYVGIIHGIAMIFHQMTVLFGIVIMLRFIKYKISLYYLLAGTIIVTASYYLAAYDMGINKLDEFIIFFKGYMANEKILESNTQLPFYFGIYGLFTALLGGRYLLSLEPIKEILETNFSGHMFDRIVYLHHQTSDVSGVIQITAYILFTMGFISILHNWWKKSNSSEIIKSLWVLFFTYTMFFCFWYPHNTEFWGIQMVCLILIFLSYSPPKLITSITVSMVIIINILGSGLPLKDPKNDYYGDVRSLFHGNIKRNLEYK